MKLRLASPVGAHRRRPPARPVLRPRRRRPRRRRRPDPPPRPRDLRRCWPSRCRSWPTPPARSATPRSATAAPSAARWPTPIRPPTCPRWCWPWAATLVARGPGGEREIAAPRLLPGLPRVGARARRAAHRDPRAQGGRRRLVVPEVQPPGPGLGHRRRGRGAPTTARRAWPWSTWAPPRSSPRAWSTRWSAGASATDAAEHAVDDAEPQADINASVEFRSHLARVLVRRALEEAGG